MGAVNEDANAGYSVAFVVEVGLDVHLWGRLILSKMREPTAILVEVIEELALEGRRWIKALT